LVQDLGENLPEKFGDDGSHEALGRGHEPLEIHITEPVSENLRDGLGLPDVLGVLGAVTWVMPTIVPGLGEAPRRALELDPTTITPVLHLPWPEKFLLGLGRARGP
jgi:hypothetical protein